MDAATIIVLTFSCLPLRVIERLICWHFWSIRILMGRIGLVFVN